MTEYNIHNDAGESAGKTITGVLNETIDNLVFGESAIEGLLFAALVTEGIDSHADVPANTYALELA